MQKEIVIFIAAINICCSCSVYRQRSEIEHLKGDYVDLVNDYDKGLNEGDFFIEKGVISFENREQKGSYIFNLKYNKTDRYLISIRNKAGVEGIRAYITPDTVLVNDRINKKLLFGEILDLEVTIGVPFKFLTLVLRDIFEIKDVEKEIVNTANNRVVTKENLNGDLIRQTIDQERKKVIFLEMERVIEGDIITVSFNKFKKALKNIPGKISINDKKKGYNFTIEIKKLIIPWDGNIEFIPGRGFELMKL